MREYQPFRKRRSHLLAALMVVLALFLSFSSSGNLFGMRSVLISVIYPFQMVTAVVWKGAVSVPSSLFGLINLSGENSELKEKLSASLAEKSLLNDLEEENVRLRMVLGFQSRNHFGSKLLPAQVIGRDAASWFSTLEINRGSAQGIKINMPVIAEKGLVGKIIEVSRFSAKVQLIIDPDSGVAAVDKRSRDCGLARGFSPNLLVMQHVTAGGDVEEGDEIVTASISSLFPPGIPIGTVSRAAKKEQDLFFQIEIRPAVKFTRLEEVFVLI